MCSSRPARSDFRQRRADQICVTHPNLPLSGNLPPGRNMADALLPGRKSCSSRPKHCHSGPARQSSAATCRRLAASASEAGEAGKSIGHAADERLFCGKLRGSSRSCQSSASGRQAYSYQLGRETSLEPTAQKRRLVRRRMYHAELRRGKKQSQNQ
jgi:hypothetical protein